MSTDVAGVGHDGGRQAGQHYKSEKKTHHEEARGGEGNLMLVFK